MRVRVGVALPSIGPPRRSPPLLLAFAGRPAGPTRRTVIEAQQLAAEAAALADQKKGLDITVLDVGERLKVADYFVLVTATSKPHVKALFNEVHVGLKALGERHLPVEGGELGWWLLLDYGDVVVHLMQADAREFYDLDNLYGDCPQLNWRELAPEGPTPAPIEPSTDAGE